MTFYHWTLEQKWSVGSEHGNLDEPEYRYDLAGYPFFIGIDEQRVGAADFHIAIGIQNLETALEIVNAHNRALPT